MLAHASLTIVIVLLTGQLLTAQLVGSNNLACTLSCLHTQPSQSSRVKQLPVCCQVLFHTAPMAPCFISPCWSEALQQCLWQVCSHMLCSQCSKRLG